MDNDSMSAELKMLNKLEEEAEILEKSSLANCQASPTEDIELTGHSVYFIHYFITC